MNGSSKVQGLSENENCSSPDNPPAHTRMQKLLKAGLCFLHLCVLNILLGAFKVHGESWLNKLGSETCGLCQNV